MNARLFGTSMTVARSNGAHPKNAGYDTVRSVDELHRDMAADVGPMSWRAPYSMLIRKDSSGAAVVATEARQMRVIEPAQLV